MKIRCWDVADAGVLASIYNEQLARVPHCYPISKAEFESGIRYRKYSDEPYKELCLEKIIIVEQDGRIIGFADVAMGEIEVDGQKKHGGLIRFLTYQPGYRQIGQAILEASERYLCKLSASQIWAFQNACNYRFYHLGFGMLSDRMGHVYGLFRMNGYEIDSGEIFLSQPEYAIVEPVPPGNQVEIVVKQEPGRGVLPGLTVQAFRSGNEIGVCESVSAGEFCHVSKAQECFFTEGLGVEEEEQGKGWGRYLLQRARWEMRKIGYQNAIISTDWKNYRALLFYTNYGYQVTDTVYGFAKTI